MIAHTIANMSESANGMASATEIETLIDKFKVNHSVINSRFVISIIRCFSLFTVERILSDERTPHSLIFQSIFFSRSDDVSIESV